MELLIIDTTQIQPYIFGSNRLRENVIASYLVNAATQDWVVANLPAKHNVLIVQERVGTRFDFNDEKIEAGKVQAEVIYMGGGNAAILFDSETTCSQFVRKHTRHVLCHAPNLQLVIYRQAFEFDTDNLYDAMTTIFEDKLEQYKQARVHSNPLLGLGVTAACQSTGMPAMCMSERLSVTEPKYPVSAEIAAKTRTNNLDCANERLEAYLEFQIKGSDYKFPSDFDKIGRSAGEHSYIAIVHADGDGVGSRLIEIGAKFSSLANNGKTTHENNRNFIATRRDFSQKLKQAAREAMHGTLTLLTSQIEQKINKDGTVLFIEHRNGLGDILPPLRLIREERKPGKNDQFNLPFRPIVFGGDDVTFVCDGRLGLALANDYLQRFKAKTTILLQDHIGTLTASAGVSIVKSHYPFSRAYDLSSKLADSAKDYRHDLKRDFDYAGGCIDWHFAMSGLMGDLKTIRDQHYATAYGKLTLRPVTLEANPDEAYRSWEFVYDGLAIFQDLDKEADDKPDWSTRRNKIKALRDVLRDGPTATRQYVQSYLATEGRLPRFDHSDPFEQTGWNDNYCGYFDAIEAADWYMLKAGDHDNS